MCKMLRMGSTATSTDLRSLPAEPWGARLRRARDLAGFTLDDAAEYVSKVILTSGATISRLEARDSVPEGPRAESMRRRAYCLALLYKFDPADFDLSPDDEPGTTSDLGSIASRQITNATREATVLPLRSVDPLAA